MLPSRPDLWPLPYLPYFHLMALAPLDIWLRLLLCPHAVVPARYWPRLAVSLLISACATVLTLPERVTYALWARLRPPLLHARVHPPLFILGYYRSGTTHLHYLLNCDPQLYSPKWFQTLAPQGFILSWSFLRFFLVPFIPSTRVQDAMSFGVNAPSEDDFALSNWALASALPGRAVVPALHRFYDRFHDLERLTPREHERWCRYQMAFLHKLSLVAGCRRLLLKTPSHTARVATLLKLFPRAQFIHISRHPHAVVRSNVSLLRVAQIRYGLQDPWPAADTQPHVIREYVATEESYLHAKPLIPPGQLAEVRFEDLLADPLGEMRRLYSELNLPFTEAFGERLRAYLDRTRNYPSSTDRPWNDEERQQLAEPLVPLTRQFGYDRPLVRSVNPLPAHRPVAVRLSRVAIAGVVTALACGVIWLLYAGWLHHRCDWLVWPTGIAIGLVTRRAAQRERRLLGSWSALLTLLVLVSAALATTRLLQLSGPTLSMTDLWWVTMRQLRVEARLFWSFMGMVSAYKLAAQPDA